MNIQPSTISPYVAEAAERAASQPPEAQARAQRDGSNVVRGHHFAGVGKLVDDAFLTADIYQILVIQSSGETYTPDTDWPTMCSKRMTLDHLMDTAFADCRARVIFRPASGTPEDVSEEFARLYARHMFEGGSDFDAVCDIRFISSNLTNREIAECRR